MTIEEMLEYQTLDEAVDALKDSLVELSDYVQRAREAGDRDKVARLHVLINEDLDLLISVLETRYAEARIAMMPVFSHAS